ncbi:thiol reductant ABC exporter subunit CydC [Rhodococcus rhodnii]|uniref:thiol reductant ABC exporter subunit CydC n=1 Tax=Rhodococcus rhodnii TaxID=38312 RepID=UPI001EE6BE2F|nr:thiol reductant ABC exporter subunit CydC [Rhodococcus rhodnii]
MSTAVARVERAPLRRALALLDLERGAVVRSVLAGVATLGSALALAALSAWLIMRAWEMPPVLDLTVAVTAVRALGISRGLFRYLERLSTHDTALRGTTAARANLYRRLADGDPAAALGIRRGDLLARTGADVDELGDVVVRAVIPIAVAAVMAVLAVGGIALISPVVALILAVALVLSGVVAPWMSARAAQVADDAGVRSRAAYSDAATTALDHAAELRVAGRLGDAVALAGRAQAQATRDRDRGATWSALAAAATPLAIGASVIGALLVGLGLYGTDLSPTGSGAMSPMALGILVLLPLSAFEATAVLPDAARTLGRARGSARRILALLDDADRPRSVGHEPWDGHGTLEARGLRSGWPAGSETAGTAEPRTTDPLDLDVAPGSRIVLTGPSGAGKTTVLMTLAGLLPPVAGTLTAGGRDVATIVPDDMRRAVAFFAEDAHLFDTSVLENLRVVRGDVTTHEAREVLRRVGLADWVDALPDGLDTTISGARAVSGGQRRRLLLARALLSRAPILLLDEPTEHLDAADGADVLRRLLARDAGLVGPERAVVVVTHQLPPGTDADRVIEVRPAVAAHSAE